MDWWQPIVAGGIWAGSVATLLMHLHGRNVKAKEEARAQYEEHARAFNRRFDHVDARIGKMDADLSALTVQMAATVADAERRFLPRSEHTDTIARLDGNIVELTRTLNAINAHLIDLARGRKP